MGSIAVAFISAGYFIHQRQKHVVAGRDSDGNMLPFTCPDHDTVILEEPRGITDKSFDEEFPDAFSNRVTIFDTRDERHMGHSFPTDEWIQKMRDWESQTR